MTEVSDKINEPAVDWVGIGGLIFFYFLILFAGLFAKRYVIVHDSCQLSLTTYCAHLSQKFTWFVSLLYLSNSPKRNIYVCCSVICLSSVTSDFVCLFVCFLVFVCQFVCLCVWRMFVSLPVCCVLCVNNISRDYTQVVLVQQPVKECSESGPATFPAATLQLYLMQWGEHFVW